jgi:hypothetical protein
MERLADDQATREEVRELSSYLKDHGKKLRDRGWKKVWIFLNDALTDAAFVAHADGPEEKQRHCQLVRDVFGNLFWNATAASEWLTWNGGTVPKLAQTIYEEGAFDRLPILADALEEAGCDDADILSHCREPGAHVRGCWVLDLLLGKQ